MQKECAKQFRPLPRIAESEASLLIEFMIKSARRLVVEPPMTVGLRFCSAAFHDDSCS